VAIIYKFPNKLKTLREKINDGFVTEEIRDLLLEELEEFSKFYPNSWDKRFTENMIHYRKKLTDKQISQIERILQEPILNEEHPNGIQL